MSTSSMQCMLLDLYMLWADSLVNVHSACSSSLTSVLVPRTGWRHGYPHHRHAQAAAGEHREEWQLPLMAAHHRPDWHVCVHRPDR